MDNVPMSVRQDLELNVMGAFDVLLDEHITVAERSLRFARGHFHVLAEFRIRTHNSEAPTAATGTGLDDDRIAGLGRKGQGFLDVADTSIRAGNNRNTD